MTDRLLLVGLDACVLIEAVRLPKDHPSAIVLQAASSGVFRLVLVAQVEREARAAVGDHLDTILEGCIIERWADPPPDDVAAAYPVLCPRMKHGNDVPVAVAIRAARPDYFVSSNDDHWRPSLGVALGRVKIRTPRRFLIELGVPAPPKRKSGPSASR